MLNLICREKKKKKGSALVIGTKFKYWQISDDFSDELEYLLNSEEGKKKKTGLFLN